MTKNILTKPLLLSLLLGSSLFAQTLTLTVTNLKNSDGKLYIGLYDKAEGFTKIPKTFKNKIVSNPVSETVYTFENLPSGTYAISIFHDENGNDAFDKNLFGVPKEGYGFSNNIRHMLKSTSFEEAKFELVDDMNLTINIGY